MIEDVVSARATKKLGRCSRCPMLPHATLRAADRAKLQIKLELAFPSDVQDQKTAPYATRSSP